MMCLMVCESIIVSDPEVYAVKRAVPFFYIRYVRTFHEQQRQTSSEEWREPLTRLLRQLEASATTSHTDKLRLRPGNQPTTSRTNTRAVSWSSGFITAKVSLLCLFAMS